MMLLVQDKGTETQDVAFYSFLFLLLQLRIPTIVSLLNWEISWSGKIVK